MKKILALIAALAIAATLTACGSKPAEETTEATTTVAEETEAVAEEETEAAAEETEATSDFTLLDLSADMVTSAAYGISEDSTEVVFTTFTAPSGTEMAALAVVAADGTGDLICGQFTCEYAEDADGVQVANFNISDVYTGSSFDVIFAGSGDTIVITNAAGDVYGAAECDADTAITLLGTAIGIMGY